MSVKRVDRFLRVAQRVASRSGGSRSSWSATESSCIPGGALAGGPLDLGRGLARHARHLSANDVVALTSDNEGTPVSLIEAPGRTGCRVDRSDEAGFGDAPATLLENPGRRDSMGVSGRKHGAAFSLQTTS